MNIKARILKIVKSKPTTIYQIAKELKVSWSTARIYIYELLAEGKVKRKKKSVGLRTKIFWSAK